MANDRMLHISYEERTRWDKVVMDFANHLGSGGVQNHMLGNGSIPGFSTNDFTNMLLDKLNSIDYGALNNPHPPTHPYTMIEGLHSVAHTGNYLELINRPIFPEAANGCDAGTVGGIRITIGPSAPSNPVNFKELWLDTTNKLVKCYYDDIWNSFYAVYA